MAPPAPDTGKHRSNRWLSFAIKIAVIGVCVLIANNLMNWLTTQISASDTKTTTFMFTGMIVLILIGYALLIAIPFVPGIEIGLGLLAMQGAAIAPYVYVFTVLGLWIAFLIGQKLPYLFLQKTLLELGLHRIAGLVAEIAPLDREERTQWMETKLPRWIGPRLVRWRYVLLALAINVPGNTFVGGGGGICFSAGLTRLFNLRLALLTLALAVAPMPLLFFSLGIFELPS